MRHIAALLLAAGAMIFIPVAPATAAAPSPLALTVVVSKKGVVGGPKRFKVKRGTRVVLVVRSAVAGEIHVHGYDLERLVRAGGTVRIPFRATLIGRFELELHARIPLRIGELIVRP